MVFCMLRIQTFDLCKLFKLNRDESKPSRTCSRFSSAFRASAFRLASWNREANGYLHGAKKNSKVSNVGSWNQTCKFMNTYYIATLNGHKLSRSQFRRNKLFIYVIFFLQYEMWQQDRLINMEAGQTKLPKKECRIPEAYFQFPSSTWEVLNSES